MKITFRVECPHCKWGNKWNDNHVNMGWIELTCSHCSEIFYNKITISGVNVETSAERPENLPTAK